MPTTLFQRVRFRDVRSYTEAACAGRLIRGQWVRVGIDGTDRLVRYCGISGGTPVTLFKPAGVTAVHFSDVCRHGRGADPVATQPPRRHVRPPAAPTLTERLFSRWRRD